MLTVNTREEFPLKYLKTKWQNKKHIFRYKNYLILTDKSIKVFQTIERVLWYLEESGWEDEMQQEAFYLILKGQYRHGQCRLSTGHGIGVLV